MTISRSNFIVISITMAAILFLFQFSNISARFTSDATINPPRKETVQTTRSDVIKEETLRQPNTYTTAIIGTEKSVEASMAVEWCTYLKRSYERFLSLEQYDDNNSQYNQLLIVTKNMINSEKDVKLLQQAAKEGIHIIITTLPSISRLRSSPRLQKLLGIKKIESGSWNTNGITVFDGFLLGGKTNYTKFKKLIPYVRLKSGTKTYITAQLKEQGQKKIKNEDLPPVIWRYQYENSFVFAVNWDFFKDHTALGMLTSMYADTEEYFLYPVINAQSVICQNYPYLSNENETDLRKNYYYSASSLCKNVLWPDITSILSATGEKFSGMTAPKLEYSDSNNLVRNDSIDYFFKQNERIQGELGLSGDQVESDSFYDVKLKYDNNVVKAKLPDYSFNVFSPGNMPEDVYRQYLGAEGNMLSDVCTLVLPKEAYNKPIVSFFDKNIVQMLATIDGFSHTSEEDIYQKSLETALGYSAVYLDFKRILYPTDKKDDWTQLSKKLASYLNTYWREYRKGFQQTTVSEADENIRRFLALNYYSYRQEDNINLTITNFDTEASFILMLTNEEIVSVSGGTFKKLEKDRYCVTATDSNLVIHVDSVTGVE